MVYRQLRYHIGRLNMLRAEVLNKLKFSATINRKIENIGYLQSLLLSFEKGLTAPAWPWQYKLADNLLPPRGSRSLK